MQALASVVVDKIVRGKKTSDYFDGLSFHVPTSQHMYDNPQCHSIVGQQLLLVDCVKLYGLKVQCPGCRRGDLSNDRTKILFPIFNIEGPPHWSVCGHVDDLSMLPAPLCSQRWRNTGATTPIRSISILR